MTDCMMLGEIFRKPSAHKRKNKTNSFRNVQVVIHIHLPLFFLEQSRYKFLPTINLRLMQIDSHSKMQQRRSNFETSRYLFCMNTCLAIVIIFKYATKKVMIWFIQVHSIEIKPWNNYFVCVIRYIIRIASNTSLCYFHSMKREKLDMLPNFSSY